MGDEGNKVEAGGVADGVVRGKAGLKSFFMEACGHSEIAAQILDAAIGLFARKGYAATSVREIVQEAQVTNPTLYYYFQSKEGVFTALLDSLVGSFDAQVERLVEEVDTPIKAKLLRIMELHMRAAREAPVVLRFIFSVSFGPRDSTPPMDMPKRRLCMMQKIATLFEDAVQRGELELSEGFDPFYLAQTFMGLVANQMMFALKMREYLDSEDPIYKETFERCVSEQNAEELVRFFFAGAGKIKER
jgi:AcrR family transcriptional regulator